MKFLMNRNHTVTSTMGHSIAFKKGVATHVPREMEREVLAAGAYTAEGEGEVDMDDTKKGPVALEGDERIEMLKMILADMKVRNDREDFTATGTPKVKAVAEAAGFDVTAPEIGALWTEMNQAGE